MASEVGRLPLLVLGYGTGWCDQHFVAYGVHRRRVTFYSCFTCRNCRALVLYIHFRYVSSFVFVAWQRPGHNLCRDAGRLGCFKNTKRLHCIPFSPAASLSILSTGMGIGWVGIQGMSMKRKVNKSSFCVLICITSKNKRH
jgi:hypothetical protein